MGSWMGGWMGELMDGWMDECLNGRMNGWMAPACSAADQDDDDGEGNFSIFNNLDMCDSSISAAHTGGGTPEVGGTHPARKP